MTVRRFTSPQCSSMACPSCDYTECDCECHSRIGRIQSLQGLTANARRAAETRINRELSSLRNEMEKSLCMSCGFTGYEHQDWCPKSR